VVLLLKVNQQTLAERVAYRSHASQQSDIFSDLIAVQAMTTTDQSIATLLTLQEHIAERLGNTEDKRFLPKAIIEIEADDLGKAALDAVAAIEGIS
jgi:hypothetical protein